MNSLRNEVRNLQSSLNLQEVVKRLLKYFIEGCAVAVVAFYIPNGKLSLEQVLTISATAAATFAILDLFAPSVGSYARQGAGFGVGAKLVKFPKRG